MFFWIPFSLVGHKVIFWIDKTTYPGQFIDVIQKKNSKRGFGLFLTLDLSVVCVWVIYFFVFNNFLFSLFVFCIRLRRQVIPVSIKVDLHKKKKKTYNTTCLPSNFRYIERNTWIKKNKKSNSTNSSLLRVKTGLKWKII